LSGQKVCAWVFANGELAEPDRLKTMLRPGDALFAADGGQRHLAKMGLRPERVIGDLDSIDPDELSRLEEAGVILERYPVDKDETDLELAIRRVIQEGFRALRIAGSLGGRLDQTLGNLFLLQQPELAGLDVRLEDGSEEVFLIRQQGEITGAPGDTVSLLPLNGPAQGVTTVGLKYPLRHETLYPDKTRGISNVMLAEKAGVSISSGLLICIHSRK
jgi:thiamine pyrophosphokinase